MHVLRFLALEHYVGYSVLSNDGNSENVRLLFKVVCKKERLGNYKKMLNK